MIHCIAKIFDSLSTRGRFLLSSLILFGFTLIIFFVIFPIINVNNIEILDSKFYYSPKEAYELISSYSLVDRRLYLINALTFDMIFPVIYSLLFGTLLTGFSYRQISSTDSCYFIRFFPLIGGVSDIFENISISILISGLPKTLYSVAFIACCFTTIKWIVLISSTIFTIFFGVKMIWDRIFSRNLP